MNAENPQTSLSGKTMLITGATSGIGLETSVKLATLGAEVVMVGRDESRCQMALAEVKARSGSSAVSMLRCDFASQQSIRQLVAAYRASHDRLDVLINNAGTWCLKRQLTIDGLEEIFAVNHLGPFLLTQLLLDLVEKSAPARIVNVASVEHKNGKLDFENLQYQRGGFSGVRAYARSKLAVVLFTVELARRFEGKGVSVNCLCPGAVATRIWSHAPPWVSLLLPLFKPFMLSPSEGAEKVVYLATSPEVSGQTGGYYLKNRRVPPSPVAQDQAVVQALWNVSEKLTGLAAGR